MASKNAIPEKQISEFVREVQELAGANLESLVLYGSAVSGDYEQEFSNINLLAILKDTTLPKLLVLAPVIRSWTKRHPAPLLITRDELERSADVFSIELLDMKRRHRVLAGTDVISQLEIPMRLHRTQLEYELREKLILLRQRLLAHANDEKQIWQLLLRSVSAFATLFRHALIAQGATVPATKRDSVRALAANVAFDASPFDHLLDIREGRADSSQFQVQDLAGRYLAAVEQVTAAVDKMLDSPPK